MERKYSDVYAGGFLLVLSIVMFISTFSIQALTDSRVGADFMPKIIAVLIAILSIFIIVNGFRRKDEIVRDEQEVSSLENEVESKNDKSYLLVIISVALMFIYLFLIPILGFLISTTAFLLIQMLLFSEWKAKNIILYLIISIIASTLIYYLFRNVFYVMLPSGILG